MPKRIAVLGYGHLGKYLVEKILKNQNFELIFVWNRSEIKDELLNTKYILKKLEDFYKFDVDVIIEVAHPSITELYGAEILKHAHYMIGSPTALANQETLNKLEAASKKYNHKIYVPCGAFWGYNDIIKMANLNTLKALSISMKKHPLSLKLENPLKEKLENYINNDSDQAPCILYEGSVRGICNLAPNNVNTMAIAALSAHNLGFDQVNAFLIADKSLTDRHLIEIEVIGPHNFNLNQSFKCTTVRSNPASIGSVTGIQTYDSFYNSLLEVLQDKTQSGIEIC